MKVALLLGDSHSRMRDMQEGTLDVLLCDPPYGLEFMGKKWDRLDGVGTGGASFTKDGMGKGFKALPSYTGSPNPLCLNCGGSRRGRDRKGFRVCRCSNPKFPNIGREQGRGIQEWHTRWLKEAYRVLRPGGYAKVFGGTRVFHRLSAAMSDAGFTSITIEAWNYASGFPKNHPVAVYMDRMITEGKSREIIRKGVGNLNGRFSEAIKGFESQSKAHTIVSDEARMWEGWGTALKPAWEPVLVGRKP